MDLIYMNAAKEDVGVIADYTFDLAFGADENDFECVVDTGSHCCEAGFYLYYEGTEYGGVIDSIKVDTDKAEITYIGRTWHGLLESKVIEPLKATDASGGGATVHKGGKNLIPYPYHQTTKTLNGVTFTVNDNGTILVNGTNTGTYTSQIYPTVDIAMGLEPNTTYTLSGCPSGGTASTYRLRIIINYKLAGNVQYMDYGNGVTFTTPSNYVHSRIMIDVPVGATVENLTFYPQVEVGEKATTYQPYKSLEKEYLMLSGEANSVIGWLIDRMGLGALFKASEDDSGINVSNYKMNRYIGGYAGIRKMLKASGAKLNIAFKNGFVELSARPFVDYSKDEQFDTDMIDFVIQKNFKPLNHVICLGAGNLAEREIIHVYADASGEISEAQTITGVDEVAATYDNANAESSEALMQGGIDMIKASWGADKVDFDFDSNDETFDIGDVVGAVEFTTGISASSEITKKIVKIKDNTTTISYKVGE